MYVSGKFAVNTTILLDRECCDYNNVTLEIMLKTSNISFVLSSTNFNLLAKLCLNWNEIKYKFHYVSKP